MKQKSGVRCSLTYPLPPLPARVLPVSNRDTLTRFGSALGDATRVRIIELLRARDLSTRELSGFLGIAAPLISRHLRELLRVRLVERYRSGYFVMYRLRRETVAEVARCISDLAGL